MIILLAIDSIIIIGLTGLAVYSIQRNPQRPGSWNIGRWWFGYQKQKTVFKNNTETPVVDSAGKPVMEQVSGRWYDVKKKLTTVIFKSLVFMLAPLFILVAIKKMGNIVLPILLALIIAFTLIVISSEITIKRPLKALLVGCVIGLVSFIFPELVSAPVILACWLMCTLGVILYLTEEVVEPNVFPKGLAIICTSMLALNILQAISALVLGHAVYLQQFSPPPRMEMLVTERWAEENIADQLTGDHFSSKTGTFGRIHGGHVVGKIYATTNTVPQSAWNWLKTRATREVTETPLLQHSLAEWGRFGAVMQEFFDCWLWFWAQVLILTVSIPTDIQQWWEQKKKERTEGKKTEHSSSVEFFVLDFVSELLVHGLHERFFAKIVK